MTINKALLVATLFMGSFAFSEQQIQSSGRFQIIHTEGPKALKIDTETGRTWEFFVHCGEGKPSCWVEVSQFDNDRK